MCKYFQWMRLKGNNNGREPTIHAFLLQVGKDLRMAAMDAIKIPMVTMEASRILS